MKDRFNFENESFEQCEEKIENEYSVNIPMRYYYKGKFRKGWTNITNCFRGTWVVGTPGSGKTFNPCRKARKREVAAATSSFRRRR